jgi:mitogen-activated protein kinase kinase kinase
VYFNIFLEYIPGGSVANLLTNYGAFEEELVRGGMRQVLQGLNYLHEQEIIHGDIKGGSILVDNRGRFKISPFGISKMVEIDLTGERVYRPRLQDSVFWMAPEVVKQTSYTLKVDIWSVGCLVVEMLTGEHPWAQLDQMQAIFKVPRRFPACASCSQVLFEQIGSSAKPAFPSDISADTEDFLKQAFELDHTLRPSTSALMLHPWII